MNRSFVFASTFSAALAYWGGHTSFAAEAVPFETAISIIESAESHMLVTEWKVRATEELLDNQRDVKGQAERTPRYFSDGFVRFDPLTGRFLAGFDNVSTWKDGLAPYAGSRREFSFDGEIYRHWKRMTPGTELPTDEVVPLGEISRDAEEAGGESFRSV